MTQSEGLYSYKTAFRITNHPCPIEEHEADHVLAAFTSSIPVLSACLVLPQTAGLSAYIFTPVPELILGSILDSSVLLCALLLKDQVKESHAA